MLLSVECSNAIAKNSYKQTARTLFCLFTAINIINKRENSTVCLFSIIYIYTFVVVVKFEYEFYEETPRVVFVYVFFYSVLFSSSSVCWDSKWTWAKLIGKHKSA